MNILVKRRPRNLDEWLKIATRSLNESSGERIRTEIREHYLDAVEEHVQSGATKPGAQVSALTDLGNAYRAKKRFRQAHLTIRETRQISIARKAARSGWELVLGYLLFFLGSALMLDSYQTGHYRYPVFPIVATAVLMVVLPTICFFVYRYSAKRSVSLAVLTQMLASARIPVYFLMSMIPNESRYAIYGVVLNLALLAWTMFDALYLSYKLRRIGVLPQEIPPSGAKA